MTTGARSEVYDPKKIGVYHCTSRCVRRAYLCGEDAVTGQSFEHRRGWIRDRLTFLAGIFAIEVFAYAVMSNHLHSLLMTRPDIVTAWSDDEVARKWRLLFPKRREKDGTPAEPSEAEILALKLTPGCIENLRERLGNLSWFHRCLNENIARAANREDDCKGRFWEGRFKSQRADDLAAILACGIYVDLNPIRAGIAATPEASDYTSIQDRIRAESRKYTGAKELPEPSKVPLISIEEITGNRFTTAEYISLVDITGRQLRAGKASIPPELMPILERLKINPNQWVAATRDLRKRFPRVIGAPETMAKAAEAANRSWFWGKREARELYLM